MSNVIKFTGVQVAELKGVKFSAALASAMNRDNHPFLRAWEHKIHTIEPAKGTRLFVEISDDDVLTVVTQSYVQTLLVNWLRAQNIEAWTLSPKVASEAVELFRAYSTPIDEVQVRQVSWLTEKGYTWHRLPWDPSEGATPTWDTLLGRMTNQRAFRAFIGSLFFKEAENHQYCWIYGPGGDGKGAINRFLAQVFGNAYRSKQPPAPGDRFWTYGLLNARLTCFPDCNGKGFTASGLFKSLTGGDPVDVEAKGQMSFTTKLETRFIFLSNEKPTLSSERADMRRVIYCAFEDGAEREQGFEARLWAEGGAFLTRCMQDYLELCPDHGDIPSDANGIEDWVAALEEDFSALFDKHFQMPNEAYRTSKGVAGLPTDQLDLVTVKPEALQDVLAEAFPRQVKRQREFRDWLCKRHQVERKGVRVSDKDWVVYRYVGMQRRLLRS